MYYNISYYRVIPPIPKFKVSLFRRTFVEVDAAPGESVSFHRRYKHNGFFLIEIDRNHELLEVKVTFLHDDDIGDWRRIRYHRLGQYYLAFYAPVQNRDRATRVRNTGSSLDFGRDVLPPRRLF